MVANQIFIKTILPKNYYTETKFNGFYCYCKDSAGMTITEFEKIIALLKIKYGKSFTDFNFIDTVTEAKLSNRLHFTIYLKP